MKLDVDRATYRALLETEVPTLNNYAIGFALPKVAEGAVDAGIGGSGTLVTIDGIDGILTADHVFKLLDKSKYVGLILPSGFKSEEFHHPQLDVKPCDRISFPPQGKRSHRPDLCLLIPPLDVVGTLKSKKGFYNLSKRREQMLELPPGREDGAWILSGFSQEGVSDLPPARGFAKGKLFRGHHGIGVVTRETHDRSGFDYLTFGALYNEFYEGPDAYGGFSGGGLWQLLVELKDSKLAIADRLLSGVAFYESAKRENGNQITREIACHGRRSLYRTLIDEVRAKKRSQPA